MAVLTKQEAEITLNGGQDSSAGAEYQEVTTLRAVTDLRIGDDGEYEKKPAIATTATPVLPTGSPYALAGIDGIGTRGSEVFALTGNHGIVKLDSAGTGLSYARRNVATSTTPDSALRYAPLAASVKRSFIDSTQLTAASNGVGAVTSSIYNSTTYVVAWAAISLAGNATLNIKCFDLTTGAVTLAEQTLDLGALGYVTQIDSIPLSEVGKEGVLISVGLISAAPYTIAAYRWDAATNEVAFEVNLTTNSETFRHCLATSSTGRFYFGFSDNTSGFLTVQDRSTTAVTTTHTGNHGAMGGCSIVEGPTRTIIASIDGASVLYNATLRAEVFGSPANVITLRSVAGTAANDWFSGCTVALETRTDATNACVVFGQGTDMLLALVATIPESPRFTTAHFVDFTTTTPSASASTWIPNATAVTSATVGGRAYGLFAMNADRMPLVNQSIIVARMSCPVYASPIRVDPVARVCHERFSQYLPQYSGDSDSVSVVGSTMHFSMPADVVNTLPQTVFHSSIDLGTKPTPFIDMTDGTTLIGGGVLCSYDGTVPAEAQPVDKPTLYLINTGAGAGQLTGTYLARAVYSWVDAAGNIHRSAPSNEVSITVAGERFDAYVSALPFAAYDGSTAPSYNVELYVTADAGTVFYRMNASTFFATYSSITAKNAFFKFTTCVAGTATYPQIYTTTASGTELASTPPPAFCATARIGDLVWGINAEDRREIWHSKPLVAGYSTEWSNRNKLYIGDSGVGISDAGGVPTVFSERGIWQIYGEGPNANGIGAFTPARRLPHEVECLDGLSVCKIPQGVVFRGRRGLYLLDTGLQLQPISGPIDSDLAITGAITGYCRVMFDELAGELHMIDFDSTHWVLSVGDGKWSKWSQSASLQSWTDATVSRGRVYAVHASSTNSVIRLKAFDEATHNSDLGTWSMQTPWVRFDGVTGSMRIWEVMLQVRLGSALANSGSLTVLYETRAGGSETFTFTAADLAILGTAGQTVTLRCRVKSQRANQFRMTITEGTPTGTFSGHVPVALRVSYGVQSGGDRKKTTTQNKGST